MMSWSSCSSFFFFNDTATTEIYTLSLHDALPISFFFGEQRVELFRIIISHVVADVAHHAFTIEKDDRRDTLRSEEHTSELQSHLNLVCRLLLEKKKNTKQSGTIQLCERRRQPNLS